MKQTWKILLIAILVFLATSIVFFIYTATKSSPVVMNVKMPKDGEGSSTDFQNSISKLTLILNKADMAYGYFGSDMNGGQNFEIQNARKMILEGIDKFTKDSLIVIIKPSPEATYKNTVYILDEMAINGIKKYQMIDLSKEEKEFLAKAE